MSNFTTQIISDKVLLLSDSRYSDGVGDVSIFMIGDKVLKVVYDGGEVDFFVYKNGDEIYADYDQLCTDRDVNEIIQLVLDWDKEPTMTDEEAIALFNDSETEKWHEDCQDVLAKFGLTSDYLSI